MHFVFTVSSVSVVCVAIVFICGCCVSVVCVKLCMICLFAFFWIFIVRLVCLIELWVDLNFVYCVCVCVCVTNQDKAKLSKTKRNWKYHVLCCASCTHTWPFKKNWFALFIFHACFYRMAKHPVRLPWRKRKRKPPMPLTRYTPNTVWDMHIT